jgi:hypothetical protein
MKSFNFTILLISILLFRLNADVSIGPNFRIFPSTVTQTEVFITTHPSNPDILFSSANTITFLPFFISEGIYVSVDGGNSWYGSDTCKGEIIGLHGGDPGIAIDKDGDFIIVRLGQSPFFGLFSHYSTDNGLTWSNQNAIANDDLERAAVTTDGDPFSATFGRSYAMWVRFAPPYPVFFSFTDDGARNWSAPAQVNLPIQRCAGGDATVEDGGKIHLVWAGVSSISPFTEEFVGHASSSDGGLSWIVTERAFDINGIQGILPEKKNIRVNGLPRLAVDNSGGTRQGWIYVVTSQKSLAPAGNDPDIILNRSTDGGQTWSAGIRVNQDALNNGKIQYFPAITVDNQGGVNVIYYDDRSTSSDSSGVFLSRSIDGGNSWQDYEVTDHHFEPIPIGGLGQGYQGDNIDITVANNTLWPVWMDNSTGIYQIWSAPIDLNSLALPKPEFEVLPDKVEINSVYPNPFNSSTIIEYQIVESGLVNLTIFDLNGRLVTELMNEQHPPGKYRLPFEATNLSSGIYILRLMSGKRTDSRPLILIK